MKAMHSACSLQYVSPCPRAQAQAAKKRPGGSGDEIKMSKMEQGRLWSAHAPNSAELF